MTTIQSIKKLLVSGIAALTLVVVVACSGAGDPATTPSESATTLETTTSQVSTLTDSAITGSGNADVSTKNGAVIDTDSSADSGNSEVEPIQASFDEDSDSGPMGDAPPGPDVITPPVEVVELTPAQIVEAQSLHLANVYEDTVQSVVFIVARTSRGVGSGSGFVWDDEGHIVTNYHVIQNSIDLIVKFFNGREYRADVVAFDPNADLAIIKLIDVEHELVPITIGGSSDLRPGEIAIAIGNPFSNEFTMTTGIVSAVSRTLNSGFSSYSIPAVVQTDAAINPGNSGGPLLDMNGAVIGVNTQINSGSYQNSGVGFAVPVDLVKRVVPSLIKNGVHNYSLMGISGEPVDIDVRGRANVPSDVTGAIVMSVEPGSAADNAGLRGDSGERTLNGGLLNWDGDIIVSINSVPMKSMDDLIAYLALNTAPSEDIVVGVFRDGVEIALAMTLGSRPSIS